MRRIASTLAAASVVVGFVLSTALPAAAAPVDKPVVNIGTLEVSSSGGASYDTWRTYVTVPVTGNNFTPGGDVYVTFQDITAGTPALPNGEWIVSGSGPCGFECNNAGKIQYRRTLNYAYRTICGHYVRAWAWDAGKSPGAAYGWSYRDKLVTC